MTITTTHKARLYHLVGVSDEHTSCDCCGRQGLKRTMVLRPEDGSDFVFFGTGCGAKALTWAEGDKPAKALGAAKLARLAEDAQAAADFTARWARIHAAEEAHPHWHLVVEAEATIATPEGVEFRAHLAALRASPAAWALYSSTRDYVTSLRAEIRAEACAGLGLDTNGKPLKS